MVAIYYSKPVGIAQLQVQDAAGFIACDDAGVFAGVITAVDDQIKASKPKGTFCRGAGWSARRQE